MDDEQTGRTRRNARRLTKDIPKLLHGVFGHPLKNTETPESVRVEESFGFAHATAHPHGGEIRAARTLEPGLSSFLYERGDAVSAQEIRLGRNH